MITSFHLTAVRDCDKLKMISDVRFGKACRARFYTENGTAQASAKILKIKPVRKIPIYFTE